MASSYVGGLAGGREEGRGGGGGGDAVKSITSEAAGTDGVEVVADADLDEFDAGAKMSVIILILDSTWTRVLLIFCCIVRALSQVCPVYDSVSTHRARSSNPRPFWYIIKATSFRSILGFSWVIAWFM